jgi:hypothetical protein|tara:strand:+ start:562 stop:2001 length:1440 start_codon:yes stop_codon:yes gene_type:complete
MADYLHPDSIENKLGLGRVPSESQEGVLWRGMSGGEYKNLLEQGFLESKGEYNIGDAQKNLTIFSSDPRKAEMYAHDFAPRDFKASPESSAYVVGIKKPSDAVPQQSGGAGEFGVRGQTPTENVVKVYRGNVFRPKSERARAVLDWQEVPVSDLREPRSVDKSNLPAVLDAASAATGIARLGANEPRPKGKGEVFRGVGSLMRRRLFPLIQAAQAGYDILSDKQKKDVTEFLASPAHELFGMEKSGLEYFKDLLGSSNNPPTSKTPESRELRGKLFQELANKQRGTPETAMVEAQGKLGGGVLSYAIEHVGDLTHRMTDKYDNFKGYGYDVGNKVDRVLRSLRSEYGFEKEFNENIRAASSYRGIPENRFKDTATKALQRYADAHKNLRVYNEPQKLARDAAVALGEQRFTDAREHLSKLQNLIKGDGGTAQSGENISDAYRRAAGEFDPNFEDLGVERKASGGMVDKPLYDNSLLRGV